MQRRLYALFSGLVQGVGFRYTAERAARRFPVTGYVRNLPDGQVELLAEGEEKSLQEFLKVIRGSFHSYVRNIDDRWTEPSGEFKNFAIRF